MTASKWYAQCINCAWTSKHRLGLGQADFAANYHCLYRGHKVDIVREPIEFKP